MANVLTQIGDFFKKIGHVFAHFFVLVFGQQAAANFAKSALAILDSEFGKIVYTIVEGLQTYAVSNGGAAAAQQAFQQIKSAALSSGLDIKDSIINLMIELAVQKLKGTLATLSKDAGAASAQPPAPNSDPRPVPVQATATNGG